MSLDREAAFPRTLDFAPDDHILIWGAGGHARVAAEIVRLRGATVSGFIDDVNLSRFGESFCGARVFRPEDLPSLRRAGTFYGIVAVGDGAARCALATRLLAAGLQLPVAVHPRAVVASDSVLGAGTLVAAGAIVSVGASLGFGCIVNTGASVDHDCRIGDWVHICPGSHIAGVVNIGDRAFIGAGATVIDHVTIGAGSVIGAGAVVVSSIPESVVAYGTPARVVRPA
jgi:sugar O-acyltransferase (sialic acid O-acetyltransferase NeuD family)